MGLKVFNSNFSDISHDIFLRSDEKFHYFIKKNSWKLYPEYGGKKIQLKKILLPHYNLISFDENREYKGVPTGRSYINKYGEIINYDLISKENHPNRLKYVIKNDNILISSLRLAQSPPLNFSEYSNNELEDFVFSNGFYIFKVSPNYNIKFILYLLRSKRLKKILDEHIYRGIGISSYKEDDLLKIEIPDLSLELQEDLLNKLKPLEDEINKLKDLIVDHNDIIEEVFVNNFKFDKKEFQKVKEKKIFSLSFNDFSNNKDLRNSVKFHWKSGNFVLDELKKNPTKKLKEFISEPIILGKSITPSQYSEDGQKYYISMATIKNWYLDLDSENAKTISQDYYEENKYQRSIKKNDLIMARSGKGTIGKVALIENENIDGIFSDFTMRIRLKNYLPKFAYYYFRTEYFQHLLEVNWKGLGNTLNIFPNQIQELPLIDIPVDFQEEILKDIDSKITKQKNIDKRISEIEVQIEQLISDYFCIKE